MFDHTQHASITIASLDPQPTTVNGVGCSRSAITCGVIAQLLCDPTTTEGLFRDIDVNIFAINPGASAKDGHAQNAEPRCIGLTARGAHDTLPGAASHFDAKGVVILAMHGDLSRMGLLN